ncbi:DBIRD complex subunit ZNF326-like isoform X2 [Ambystoma mexicanum]|uniref:DBIRD complex subunit ZNF326-like isoform X2 n=2 Tax=Ambystoma mexicanum TaxID=8296 RepID=UPI0037E922D2
MKVTSWPQPITRKFSSLASATISGSGLFLCCGGPCVLQLFTLRANLASRLRSVMQRDYGHGAYGGQNQPASYGMESNDRFGPYESYDSRSSQGGRDLFRSGYGYNEPEQSRFGDSFGDGFENTYRNSHDNFGGRNQGGSSWDAPYSRSQMRPGFMDDRGRGGYSSYGGFSSSLMKPAPAGSRGRGMPAYPEGAFGGRNYDAFGGPSSGRGRGRGQMADFGGAFRAGMNPSKAGAAGRGMKRKNNPPGDKPTETVGKKAKLAKPAAAANAANNASNKVAKPAVNNEEEEKRKLEARREKQRRRREKNNEKMAFACSFCKYRTFEEKEIEAHLTSATHKETLDHIQKQTKFDKVVMEFLHECMVNKFKKTSLRKAASVQNEATNNLQKNMMEGITDDDHMMKVETVHCGACSLYVPALFSSVQQHLKSPDHAKSKVAFKEQVKRESVLTATSILNNPVVKARYEQFAKGENPFETVETQESVVGETEAQDATEQTDFSEDAAIDFTEDTTNFVEETETTTTVEETATADDAPDFAEDSTDQIDFTSDYVTTEEN